MAMPPEPVDEMLARSHAAVLAEVSAVLEQEAAPPPANPDPHAAGGHTAAGRQVVELKVTAVLFGPHQDGATVRAVKPAGAYALRAGNSGPFLLGKSGTENEILGRYGPDTWPETRIREAMARLGKK